MEDAHILDMPLGITPKDNKIGLFAVFDGHGGNLKLTQAQNVRYLWRESSPKS